MHLTKSQWLLAVASMITLVFTWQALQKTDAADTSLPTRVLSASDVSKENFTQAPRQFVLQKRAFASLESDLFAPPIVVVSKPITRQIKAQPLPKPVAPPLPFKYIGRWQDAENNAVMIDYRGEIMPIKQGDIIADQYKVLAINTSPIGLQIQFLMIPFNQIQTMQAGAAP